MSDSKYYLYFVQAENYYEEKEYCKVNRKYNLSADAEHKLRPQISVTVGRHTQMDDRIPRSFDNQKYKRLTETVFNEYFNANYSALQRINQRGGEYYLERGLTGEDYILHAFRDKPHMHCVVFCRQGIECSEFSLYSDNSLGRRYAIRKNGRRISEEAFCQAYKLVLEFLYDGEAMPSHQDQLYQAILGLVGPDAPKEEIIINQESYYQKARNLMLKRKEELKARLVELDDKPSTRRELRAQMKAIDYCVSVLDNNH